MAPSSQKALFLKERQGKFVVAETPVPKPGPGEVLVRVLATSLNPIDWKIHKYGIWVEDYPAILGNDLSGVVEQVGEGVSEWKVGDRVFAQAQVIPHTFASFQQYALVSSATLAKVPENISIDEAASLPVTLSAAYVGLYQSAPDGLGLTPPTSSETQGVYGGTPLVIIGGTGSVGQNVIQLAKLSGCSPIIATASPSQFEHLKSLGATHVFDRKLSATELKAAISAICPIPLKYAFDAISIPETQEIAHNALDEGGQIAIISPIAISPADGKSARRVIGLLRTPKNRELLETLYHDKISGWLESGVIKPNNVEVLPGGLKGIPEGLERLQAGKVSRSKLIARPHED
ncbi:hypothetical protein D9619_004334 [Psilocybe cf. subviscida]|uniref:Enoyl reductase (ER) domain-containing protein n=1 Tax=Psilocybe cf. subviscida TaxID=2480587 RepID=A0A8H5BP49_9AGAR|nr:hypothetical protein D9619_004334 [Psilocybe cf. subviscida]